MGFNSLLSQSLHAARPRTAADGVDAVALTPAALVGVDARRSATAKVGQFTIVNSVEK